MPERAEGKRFLCMSRETEEKWERLKKQYPKDPDWNSLKSKFGLQRARCELEIRLLTKERPLGLSGMCDTQASRRSPLVTEDNEACTSILAKRFLRLVDPGQSSSNRGKWGSQSREEK